MADEGAVTVCVRVRPLIAREKALEDKLSLHWKSENNTISEVNGTKVFSYDRVFHSSDSTQQLYEGVAVPIIQSAVQGYNGTIFAYGQTASGKTYTMMGNEDSTGIIPKAIQHIFKVICEIPDREFLLRVSYMEIYNETITDLLCDTRKKKPLGIREDVNRNIFVEDLIEEVVVAPEEVMEWIRKGERNRHYGETKMNEHSSRSHTIFRMIIESRERSDLANASCDGAVMVSHLNLVDLAGSERASQTGSEGVRLKEGCNINRSLFILGQVIKKLCDDPSGFINYRDSKLTRILQNSLGGNAKTVIICTITPVSFDETLSTLQFASTAKRMKNTPKVNEVLNDDALLKRYRKEILDLKKQLEEVSSKTQIHAMEKDQLAQLLEEKNSLQKVQEDRIRNLTRMLVTSASFSSKANVQAKKRRRVTWAPGKINQTNVRYFEETRKSRLSETKKMKTSLLSPTDMEDSIIENSECDSQSLVISDQIPETGWTAGPNMNWSDKYFEESVELCETLAREKDMALNRVKVLQADYNHLVLENKQLNLEINEVREKLREKTETDEFEALEKQTQKDYEIQLIHEITNLKNMVSNAEVYNEELEAEINSKLEELKKKENKIKVLQNQVEELQKARAEKKDTSFSVGSSDNLLEEIQQLNKSLLDSETIALDAKKEAAFLRSENLELKERMNELSNNYNQMQKDVQLYQSQIEAGKASYRKMQVDLQRELQAVFQENTRLTSLMEGKVPKDMLSLVELEKKAADLKGELEKALKENALLQNQVHELSQFQSLPNTVEMQQKEILEKCEELHLLKLEREKLLSEVADSEIRLQEMTEEIRKAKDDLADAQLKYVKSDQEYLALKQLHEELEQKYISVSENNEQIKLQVDVLAQEAQEAKTALDEGKLKLISRIKELEEETAEYKQQVLEVREEHIRTQQKLNELEQLEGQEKMMEMRLETKESEIQAVLQQLTECQEKVKTLTQERDDLKQKEESLQAETDQLKEDIKDTVSMNILAQEELRSAQSSLKQAQDTVKKLEKSISEKESQILSVEETLGKTIKELEIKLSQMTEEIKTIPSERDQLAEGKSENCRESNELQMQKEQIFLLTQENNSLRDKLDSLCLAKEHGEGNLISQIHEQSIEQELFLLREELDQTQRKLLEMKANECQGEPEKMGRTEPTLELPDCQEVSTQTEKGDENLVTQLENLQNERDQLRETIQETTSKNSEMMEELRCARNSLKQHQEAIVELKGSISEKENQLLEAQESLKNTTGELQQKFTEVTENLTRVSSEYGKLLAEKEQMERTMNEHISKQLDNITVLKQEKDELQQVVETCRAERGRLEADCQESKERSLKVLAEMEDLRGELMHQREQADMLKNMLANREESFQNTQDELNEVINELKEKVAKLNEDLCLATTEKHQLLELKEKTESESSKLSQLEEQCDLLAQEREKLQEMLEGVQVEKNKLEINLQESVDKILETEKKLKQQQELLREEKIKAEEREECLSKVQRQSDVLKDSLTNKIQQLTETLNSISCEKDQLLTEKTSQSFQLQEQISSINQEKDELQKLLQDVRSERDQLKTELQKRSEMCEIHSKLEGPLDPLKQRNLSHVSIQVNSLDNAEQVTDSLKEKTLNTEELLEKFLTMEKRCECLSTVSLKLKSDLESQKELIAVILPQLSSEESNQLKKLQMANENVNAHLQSLLYKLKFLFSRICSKRRDYYATVNKHEMELLEEKRKQDELRAQIQYLRKIWMNQTEISSEELNSSEVPQSLHLDAESLLKDVSEMESELLCMEAELHQQESSRRETLQFWEAVSRTECDAEELKEALQKDYERLLQGIKVWTPKSKTLYQLSLELDASIANYRENANVESKQRKEITEKLLQELKILKDQLAPDGSASLASEEENCRLHNKLKAAEQDKKAMEVKIQKLENEINEVAKDVEKKNDRINELEEQITRRVSVSELTQLQAKLDETEKQLRTTLTVNQSLQAQIDKGTEGYKEEIDSLKTQLVKCDMARMKTFNTLDKKLADYKAVAEHQKQQIKKLQEDLRRAYQEKDATVLLEKESPQQSQVPLTCGGGSGIVQSTHMLVLKSEQAKLQKENLHLKKQNDDLLCNKRELKEELVKWKERALKWREQASRKNTREAVPRSPRKAVSYFLEEQVSTPPKEPVSEETVIQDLPKPLPRACTNFFDNSSLGIPADTQFPGPEPVEEHLQRWFATPEKDKAPDCTTQ
ncbi:centromere-associated protein E [Dryobates pubescens]|uniref:centromere-associated protein E n=1 Tax=Dryobates pubescens TaxID=118200 RepID=UPI0023B9B8E9|nr:centromere-associated protein E [Dryobates pubescens]